MSRQVRKETAQDRNAVFAVNVAAFPTEAEARLIDLLRESISNHVSLVAVDNGTLVGHIMFTPVRLDSFDELRVMGLGPMAVAPAAQRGGIGTALVNAGLQHCRDSGAGAVAVLGHPGFYPRFGFKPSSRWQIRSEYDVPEEVFMLVELLPDYLADCEGIIRYHPAFANV